MKQRNILTLTLACLFVLGIVVAPAAEACTQPPTNPPIVVELHEVCFPIDEPTHCMIRAWVSFLNYSTFAAGGNQLCGCALNQVGDIKDVLYARLCDSLTGDRVAEFVFDSDNGVTAGANALFSGADTQGFQAALSGAVANGQTVDLKFEVLLKAGDWVSAQNVANSIVNSPVPVAITGEVNQAGAFVDHVGFYPERTCAQGGVCTCQKASSNLVYVNGAEKILQTRGKLTDVQVREFQACTLMAVDQEPVGL